MTPFIFLQKFSAASADPSKGKCLSSWKECSCGKLSVHRWQVRPSSVIETFPLYAGKSTPFGQGSSPVNYNYYIRAATWEKVPSDRCARRRPKSARALWQSDQSLRSPHEEPASFAVRNTPSKHSDQTPRMRRLIWIFVGCKCPVICFLKLRLGW